MKMQTLYFRFNLLLDPRNHKGSQFFIWEVNLHRKGLYETYIGKIELSLKDYLIHKKHDSLSDQLHEYATHLLIANVVKTEVKT